MRPAAIVFRAIVTGLAVMMAGQLPWSFLIGANLRSPLSPPWAVPVMACYLALYWRYLNGWGWPRASAQVRRDHCRGHGLTGPVWLRAMTAGVLAVEAAVSLQAAYGRLVRLPVPSVQDLSAYPAYTVLLALVMSGVVAGFAEEAGFRGYMQSMLEREYGPVLAISIVSIAFAAIHFSHGIGSALPRVPYYLAVSAIYGVITYRTGSVLPALVIHAVGDALEYCVIWRWGIPNPLPPIWQNGPDASFLRNLGAGLVLGLAAFGAYRSLVRAGAAVAPDAPPQPAVQP